jgi:hypothetical protein
MLDLKRQTKTLIVAALIMLSALATVVARADTVPTVVIVGNSFPAITVTPIENPASDATLPSNVGAALAFEVTAIDSGGDNYYLAVCTTNAITPNNGAEPTCNGSEICTSSATISGNVASCSYTPQLSDAESISWFVFVCDSNLVSASCSVSDQGSGSSGSPFKVNHAPNFSAGNSTANADPGTPITFSSTASDTDIDGSADTVFLLVCKTAGLSGTACDGGGSDTWCTSATAASNPSCQTTLVWLNSPVHATLTFMSLILTGCPALPALKAAITNLP